MSDNLDLILKTDSLYNNAQEDLFYNKCLQAKNLIDECIDMIYNND